MKPNLINAYAINQTLKSLGPEDRIKIFNQFENRLTDLIKDSYDFNFILMYLPEEQRKKVFHVIQDQIPTFFKKNSHLRNCLEFLAPEEQQILLQNSKEALPALITNVDELHRIVVHLSPKNCEILFALSPNLLDIIQEAKDLKVLLQDLSVEQTSTILNRLEARLPQIIKNLSDSHYMIRYLTQAQTEILSKIMENKPPPITNSREFNKAFEHLTPEQCATSLPQFSKDIPEMITNAKDLSQILQHLPPEQFPFVLELIREKLPQLIKNSADLDILFKILNPLQVETFFTWACKAKNLELVDYFLSNKQCFKLVRFDLSDQPGIFEYLKDYFDNQSLYQLLSKKMTDQEMIKDAAKWGNISYFEYVLEIRKDLITPQNLKLAFLTAAYNHKPELIDYLSPKLSESSLEEAITGMDYRVIKKLALDIKTGTYKNESEQILNKFKEIAQGIPEIITDIDAILSSKRLRTPVQAPIVLNQKVFKSTLEEKQDLVIEQLQILCKEYDDHLQKQKIGSHNVSSALLVIKKGIVSNLLEKLNDPKLSKEAKIDQFKKILNDTNKEFLSTRRDSSRGMQFLEAVAQAFLSLGIYSKLTKGSFQFWKSHGEAFSDQAEKITSNLDARPKK